jgi:DNA excision repair protein ERCC-1
MPPPPPPSGAGDALLISERQRGNPIIKYIRHVKKRYVPRNTTDADYELGSSACALYLSLKYHMLKRGYLYSRLTPRLRNAYALRVLLVNVDVEDNEKALLGVMRVAKEQGLTLVLAWSHIECARYLETYKAYEHKGPEGIMGKGPGKTLMDRITACLTTVRGVNKTDCLTLATAFGSMRGIIEATIDELTLCPGIGQLKATRIFEAFHTEF